MLSFPEPIYSLIAVTNLFVSFCFTIVGNCFILIIIVWYTSTIGNKSCYGAHHRLMSGQGFELTTTRSLDICMYYTTVSFLQCTCFSGYGSDFNSGIDGLVTKEDTDCGTWQRMRIQRYPYTGHNIRQIQGYWHVQRPLSRVSCRGEGRGVWGVCMVCHDIGGYVKPNVNY